MGWPRALQPRQFMVAFVIPQAFQMPEAVTMRMRALLVLALCSWSVASEAETDVGSGNFFLPSCKAALADADRRRVIPGISDFRKGFCAGVAAVLKEVGPALPLRWCPPAGVTNVQTIRVIVAFLEAQPRRLHDNFMDLSIEALMLAWPCPRYSPALPPDLPPTL